MGGGGRKASQAGGITCACRIRIGGLPAAAGKYTELKLGWRVGRKGEQPGETAWVQTCVKSLDSLEGSGPH